MQASDPKNVMQSPRRRSKLQRPSRRQHAGDSPHFELHSDPQESSFTMRAAVPLGDGWMTVQSRSEVQRLTV